MESEQQTKANQKVHDLSNLNQTWQLPSRQRPIVIIGAGGIVNDAHLPAYTKSGFPVLGIYDVDEERSRKTAEKFSIPNVFTSLEECFADRDAVIDVAVPPQFVTQVLEAIPPSSSVLIQKPLGVDLKDARQIRQMCRDKDLTAAVNFQLRYTPMMLAIRDAIQRGVLGEILDLEIRVQVYTPWHLFPYLEKLDRVEILVHSIHYLDWIRSTLGEPHGVYARTVGHPSFPELNSTRTSAILDYGNRTRCTLSVNHNFRAKRRHQAATVTLTGHDGAVVGSLGLLLNYPTGEPETLEIQQGDATWEEIPLQGHWFPDGFTGTMSNLQRYAAGEDTELLTSVEDAYKTMAVVEACYRSDSSRGTPVPE